jgi:molybdopterin molybdotransferase
MTPMISLEDALRIALETVPAPEPADVPLVEAIGLALSRDVLADRDVPAVTDSAVDGVAVRSEEARPGATFAIVETIDAGRLPRREVGPGQASEIMTGAALPEGADAVIPVEETEKLDDGRVRLLAGAEAGRFLRLRGSYQRAGEPVLAAGREIRAAETAVLAAVGAFRVPAFARPVVAVGATGDELVPVEVPPEPGQIRNANGVTLMTRTRQAGAIPWSLGIVADEREAVRAAVREGLDRDVLVLSGGVSMGRKDLVVDALRDEGVEILFHRVAVKPGKPVVFGRRGRTLVLGLPGNPVSVAVTFELFVRPVIRKLTGHARLHRTVVPAVLGTPVPEGSERRTFLPASVRPGPDGFIASLVPYQGSGDPIGMARGDALLVVPEGAAARSTGDRAEVLLLDGALEAIA